MNLIFRSAFFLPFDRLYVLILSNGLCNMLVKNLLQKNYQFILDFVKFIVLIKNLTGITEKEQFLRPASTCQSTLLTNPNHILIFCFL